MELLLIPSNYCSLNIYIAHPIYILLILYKYCSFYIFIAKFDYCSFYIFYCSFYIFYCSIKYKSYKNCADRNLIPHVLFNYQEKNNFYKPFLISSMTSIILLGFHSTLIIITFFFYFFTEQY